jgi:hypothetical protein
LVAIQQGGAVLTNQREGVFYFYGAEEKLPKLETALRGLGFSVRPARTEPGRIATINAVIDEAWLGSLVPQLCEITSELGVEYDGWEASMPEAKQK